jgi:hypothetical protein
MNEKAREQLARMVQAYGSQVCATPGTCIVFLKQYCVEYPEEAEALSKALRDGVVTRLLQNQSVQSWDKLGADLIRDLVAAGMSEEAADWTVVSWAMALGKHPNSAFVEPTRPTEPPRDASAPPVHKKVAGQMLVGLGGGFGAAAGVFFAIGILLITAQSLLPSLRDRWVSQSTAENAHWHRLIGLLIVTASAGIAGWLGGFFGWLLGRGDPHVAWRGAGRACVSAFLVAAVVCCGFAEVGTLENLTIWSFEQVPIDLLLVPIGSLLAAAGAALSVAFTGLAR